MSADATGALVMRSKHGVHATVSVGGELATIVAFVLLLLSAGCGSDSAGLRSAREVILVVPFEYTHVVDVIEDESGWGGIPPTDQLFIGVAAEDSGRAIMPIPCGIEMDEIRVEYPDGTAIDTIDEGELSTTALAESSDQVIAVRIVKGSCRQIVIGARREISTYLSDHP